MSEFKKFVNEVTSLHGVPGHQLPEEELRRASLKVLNKYSKLRYEVAGFKGNPVAFGLHREAEMKSGTVPCRVCGRSPYGRGDCRCGEVLSTFYRYHNLDLRAITFEVGLKSVQVAFARALRKGDQEGLKELTGLYNKFEGSCLSLHPELLKQEIVALATDQLGGAIYEACRRCHYRQSDKKLPGDIKRLAEQIANATTVKVSLVNEVKNVASRVAEEKGVIGMIWELVTLPFRALYRSLRSGVRFLSGLVSSAYHESWVIREGDKVRKGATAYNLAVRGYKALFGRNSNESELATEPAAA